MYATRQDVKERQCDRTGQDRTGNCIRRFGFVKCLANKGALFLLSVVCAAGLVLAGCADSGGGDDESARFVKQSTVIRASGVDLSGAVNIRSADASVLTILEDGRAHSEKPGTTTVTAEVNGTTVTLTATVDEDGKITFQKQDGSGGQDGGQMGGNAKQWTVSFDLNGGDGFAPSSQTIDDGGTAREPSAPTRADYIFSCWYITDESAAFAFNMAITANTVLKAKWVVDYSNLIDVEGDLSDFVPVAGGVYKFKGNLNNTNLNAVCGKIPTSLAKGVTLDFDKCNCAKLADGTDWRYPIIPVNTKISTLILPHNLTRVPSCLVTSNGILKNVVIPDSVTSIGMYVFTSVLV